jgi:hypothetical protein
MDEPRPTRNTSWRPRFSLLSALLLMTVLALTIVVVQLWREVGPLRADVRRLRDEVGALSVDDKTKLHAIRVRTADEFVWKWRIWIPEGRAYLLKDVGGKIPKEGFAQANGSIRLDEPGETWVEYRISPDPVSGLWMDHLRTSNASVGSSTQEWVKWKQRVSTSGGVSYTTLASEPGETIILARERVSQSATSSSKIEDPSAGFMIWLEPTK